MKAYVESKTQMDLSMKQRITDIEKDEWLPRGGGVGKEWGGRLGVADVSFYINIGEMDKQNKILLYRTENYIQYPMINYIRKDYIYN